MFIRWHAYNRDLYIYIISPLTPILVNVCFVIAGTYQPFNSWSNTYCWQCGSGRYQPWPGSESCISCAAFTYQPFEGSLSCLPCSTVNYTGSSTCPQNMTSSCSYGTHVSGYGSSCTPCEAGKHMAIFTMPHPYMYPAEPPNFFFSFCVRAVSSRHVSTILYLGEHILLVLAFSIAIYAIHHERIHSPEP